MNITHIDGCFVRRAVLATAILGICAATSAAQTTREIQVKTLGGANRFSQSMRNIDDLRSMVNANRNQISRVLTIAGLDVVSAQALDAFSVGDVAEVKIAPGTHLEWMALKRSGTPGLLKNVRWTGRESFDAYLFNVKAAGYTYAFIVPKICGNLSLLSVTANPAAVVAEAVPEPAPPPRPEPRPEPPPPPPTPEPEPPPVAAAPPPPPPAHVFEMDWLASGFAGGTWKTSANAQNGPVGNSMAYGGQLAYAWRERVGLEFLADFAPVKLSNAALSGHPHANSYMGNLIVALPFGQHKSVEPYASGGIGGIQLRTTLLSVPGNINSATTDVAETKFGGDIGGGLVVFGGHVGFRTDVRYYKASGDSASLTLPQTPISLTQLFLSDLQFWRGNVGVSFRW